MTGTLALNAKFLFADITQGADQDWFASCRFVDAEGFTYTMSQGLFPDPLAARDWVRDRRAEICGDAA